MTITALFEPILLKAKDYGFPIERGYLQILHQLRCAALHDKALTSKD